MKKVMITFLRKLRVMIHPTTEELYSQALTKEPGIFGRIFMRIYFPDLKEIDCNNLRQGANLILNRTILIAVLMGCLTLCAKFLGTTVFEGIFLLLFLFSLFPYMVYIIVSKK